MAVDQPLWGFMPPDIEGRQPGEENHFRIGQVQGSGLVFGQRTSIGGIFLGNWESEMASTKAPELSTKSDAEIDQWIRNHEQRNATSSPLYKALLEERAARSEAKGSLEIEKSLIALKRAAKEQRFITYGDLAGANNVPWTKARHRMNGSSGHLDLLLDVCHARGLPLLPAICVNESGRKTGKLEAAALAGFIAGTRRVRAGAGEVPIIGDEKEFHRKTCEECFRWGREN